MRPAPWEGVARLPLTLTLTLAEEEKLEPLKSVDGIPRLRLLNRLNAKRLKELQERKLLEAAASSSTTAPSKEQQQVCPPAPP